MTDSKHTPGPWEIKSQHRGILMPIVAGKHGEIGVALARPMGSEPGTARANAELICRAVNAHDDMLAALEDVLKRLGETDYEPLGRIDDCEFVLQAAIAKAKGE